MKREHLQIKSISFRTITILAALIFMECMFRLVFPLPEVTNFNRMNYSPIFSSNGLNSISLSNASFTYASDLDGVEFVHNLNLFGFRDENWKIFHDPGRPRVIFVGDSFIEGFMARDDETIPAVFKRYASQKGRAFDVINLGVAATEIKEYFNLIGNSVPLFKPHNLIIFFYANDFFSVPQFHQSWLEPLSSIDRPSPWLPRVIWAVKKTLRKEIGGFRWHKRPFPFLPTVPDERNLWSSPENAKHFEKFVDLQVADAMKKGRMSCWLINQYDIHRKHLTQNINIFPHLEALSKYALQNELDLSIVYIPSRSQVSDKYLKYQAKCNYKRDIKSLTGDEYQIHARILKADCEKLKIDFLDLTPFLRAKEKQGERLYWNYDDHMRANGYAFVAHILYDWWNQNPRPKISDSS